MVFQAREAQLVNQIWMTKIFMERITYTQCVNFYQLCQMSRELYIVSAALQHVHTHTQQIAARAQRVGRQF